MNSAAAGWTAESGSRRQWYSDLPANLRVGRGVLALRAVHDPDAQAAVPPRQPFTSARIRTYTKFAAAPSLAFPTVRIEARIKVPAGSGLWPAFWLLPEDGAFSSCSGCGRYGGWANSGEIDVMELANEATQLSGTIHYGGMWPYNTYVTNTTSLPQGRSFSEKFHTYRVDWTRNEMRWYVDNRLYFRAQSGQGVKKNGWYSLQPCSGEACWAAPARDGNAPFDRKFHVILNLALGSEGTSFTRINGVGVTEEQLRTTLASPKAMLVDWVRVWGIPSA